MINILNQPTNFFNETILGSPQQPYTFVAPYDRKTKTIDDITLDREICRDLNHNLIPLVNLCYDSDKKKICG